jgi:hypothetical protein
LRLNLLIGLIDLSADVGFSRFDGLIGLSKPLLGDRADARCVGLS